MAKTFVVVGKRQDRFALYRKLKPDLIVFSELEIAQAFDAKAIIWSSQLTSKQKTEIWLEVMSSKIKKPVLATRSGVFLPFQKLSTIVVDDPHHPGHRGEQLPQYQSHDVARQLARIHGARLVLGMSALSVDDYYQLKTGRCENLPLPSWSMPEIIIREPHHQLNLDTPEVGESRHLGSELYFLPRKGEYRGSVCRDCSTLQDYPTPTHCKQCRSTRLKPYGIGTQELARKLGAVVIDQNNPFTNYELRITNYEKVVATHKIFDYDLEFGITVVTNFDHLLPLPDPFQNEYIFATLVKLAQITRKHLVIETRYPNHPAIAHLNNWRKFYEEELKLRQYEKLPPFSRLVKLTAETKLTSPELPKTAIVSPIHRNVGGRYQIIVKLKPDTHLSSISRQIRHWQLEPDPVNLI